jgi:hypothetical protein
MPGGHKAFVKLAEIPKKYNVETHSEEDLLADAVITTREEDLSAIATTSTGDA